MATGGKGLISRMTGRRKLVTGVLLVALAPFLTNCYGAFPLTRAVYQANGAIRNDLLKHVVFWVFVIVPVYGVAMLADAIVFNLIEFWFGETIRFSSVTDRYGNTVALRPSEDGREAVLTVSRDGRVIQELRFVKVSDSVCEAYNSGGSLVGRAVRTPAGGLCLTDAGGDTVALLSADQIAASRLPVNPSL